MSFGAYFLILFLAMGKGFHEKWIDDALRVHTGHIQISHTGFQDNMEITKFLGDYDDIITKLDEDKRVDAYARRVKSWGMVATGKASNLSMIVGVEPTSERKITTIHRTVEEGEYLSGEEGEIMLGIDLADKLGVELGDKVVVMNQSLEGVMSTSAFRLSGIVHTGLPDFDENAVFMNIADARKLLGYDDKISEIVVWVKDINEIEEVKSSLLKSIGGDETEVLTWIESVPELKQMVELDDVFLYISLGIIIVIVAFGILNTITMAVFERTAEFGVMMAMGTKPHQVVSLILMESIFLGLVSLLIGSVLGITHSYIGEYYLGFDLSFMGEGLESMGAINPVMHTDLALSHLLWTALIIILTAVISSIYPAIRASRFKVVEALRYV